MASKLDLRAAGRKPGEERQKGIRSDLLCEVIGVDPEKGTITAKVLAGPREIEGKEIALSLREPGQPIPGSEFQGNRIDSRLVEALANRNVFVAEAAILYPGSTNAKCRWISPVTPQVQVDGGSIPKVVTGPITATVRADREGKKIPVGVQVWDRQASEVNEETMGRLRDELDATQEYIKKSYEIYKQNGTGLPVRETTGFAFFALNGKGEMVAMSPSIVDHRSPVFRAIAEDMSDDARVKYLFSPPTGEDLNAVFEAFKEQLKELGYDDAKIVMATCRNYRPSELQPLSARVLNLASQQGILFVDKDKTPIFAGPSTPSVAAAFGVVTLSPGKVKIVKGSPKLVGAENNFVNNVYASARMQLLPEALHLKVSPEIQKAWENHLEERAKQVLIEKATTEHVDERPHDHEDDAPAVTDTEPLAKPEASDDLAAELLQALDANQKNESRSMSR